MVGADVEQCIAQQHRPVPAALDHESWMVQRQRLIPQVIGGRWEIHGPAP